MTETDEARSRRFGTWFTPGCHRDAEGALEEEFQKVREEGRQEVRAAIEVLRSERDRLQVERIQVERELRDARAEALAAEQRHETACAEIEKLRSDIADDRIRHEAEGAKLFAEVKKFRAIAEAAKKVIRPIQYGSDLEALREALRSAGY